MRVACEAGLVVAAHGLADTPHELFENFLAFGKA
jgi:hypothetical protein